MLKPENINPKQIPLMAEIVKNETWLMGEKRGHPVDPHSPDVLSKVIDIVLKSGAQWRTNIESVGGNHNMRC